LGTVFGQGVAAAYNGHGYLHNWPANPWVKGSYSFYPAGRFTEIAGAEKGRENGVHFAGEHTAPYYRRVTMDGAVVTGERAAAEILAALA
jgi:monoamine oxidase